MRKIVSISLSQKMLNDIKKKTKAGGYSSVSEFFRYVIRFYIDKKKEEK